LPFQIATHYWELDENLKNKFYDFIDYAIAQDMDSKFLNEVLI